MDQLPNRTRREPTALFVALMIGLAGALTLLATYKRMVHDPDLARRVDQPVKMDRLRFDSQPYSLPGDPICAGKAEEECERSALPPEQASTVSSSR